MGEKSRAVVFAVAAALVFADATIVTLALPSVLVQLHTTVEGVAAVLGVYTAALGLAALPAERLARRPTSKVAPAAFAAFAVGGLACAAASNLTLLLVGRVAQGLAGAFVLAVTGDMLGATARGRRSWTLLVILSGAVGPVLGGALTQAFSWRAIFIAQAPIPLLAAAATLRGLAREEEEAVLASAERPGTRGTFALGLISAALTALLFGLVLLLVVGWALRPLTAALTVSLVPVAAFLGSRAGGSGEARTAIGAALVCAGVGMLAFLPTDEIGWLLAPEVVAGIGMGLSLTALLERLLPESSSRRRASNVAVRHLGTTLALVVLAPVLAHDLSVQTEQAKLRTVALVLDAQIDPVRKLQLGPQVAASVRSENPLASVRASSAQARRGVPRAERNGFDALVRGLDTTFVGAANEAFRRAFVLAALFALAALGLFVGAAPASAAAALTVSLGLVGAQVAVHRLEAPKQVRIVDPCHPRAHPKTTGLEGFAQSTALTGLDKAACFLGSSREELVLALANRSEGKRFEHRYGVDPRSIRGLISALHRF